jgi:hypothetical protein
MTLFLEHQLYLSIIKDLAVENDTLASVFIKYRLVAAFQIDNAQPSMAQRNGTTHIIAVVIRPAVGHALGHSFDIGPYGFGTLRRV